MIFFSEAYPAAITFLKPYHLKLLLEQNFNQHKGQEDFFQKSNPFEHCLTSDYRKPYFELIMAST